MGAHKQRAWLLVYRDAGELVVGPSYGPDEAAEAQAELVHYRANEGAFLVELDLTELARMAAKKGQRQKRVRTRFCPICREDRPADAFDGGGIACAQCALEADL